ncbi:hypothetical protein LBMAG43_01180 [Methylococcaceae bacterium]|nr:hypothetical protein LBMAG43_01180 [Methylococcaceae bacterium]
MKNFILTTMLLLSFMLLIPQAKAGVVFMTGNKLVESMREYEKAEAHYPNDRYVDGTYTGFLLGVFDATSAIGVICPPDQAVSVRQVNSIVTNYLKNHPEK